MRKSIISLATAMAFGASALGLPQMAGAQSDSDLQAQVKALQEQLKAIQAQLDKQAAAQKQTETTAQAASAAAQTASAEVKKAADAAFLQRTSPDALTFATKGGGNFTLYGNLDVSVDVATNGLNNAPFGGATDPLVLAGKNGWLPAIATNNTYVGLRGMQPISAWKDTNFLWQIQTNIAISNVAGTGETNSSQNNTASGALSTGTSFVGFGGKDWGSVKIGKTLSPYYNSTLVFNPFRGQLGGMDVVMGNTGGDNRVEFGTILEHALWYESPDMDGLKVAALYAPGQNRAADSSAIPLGSSNCSGGNMPGSGGLIGGYKSNLTSGQASIDGCNDGGFSDAFSASLTYDKPDMYLVAAYELHKNVNRGSDLVGAGGNPSAAFTAAFGPSFDSSGNPIAQSGIWSDAAYLADVGNEYAYKLGGIYRIKSTGTNIGAIWESMHRDLPASLEWQNERSRNGTWLLIQQNLPGGDQINFGWAHVDAAVGDASGQHNFNQAANDAGQSTANMYTLNYLHPVDKKLSVYANLATTINNGNAHYDLGAGGHGYYVDCHSSGYGTSASGGLDSNPHCFGGTKLEGATVGVKYKF